MTSAQQIFVTGTDSSPRLIKLEAGDAASSVDMTSAVNMAVSASPAAKELSQENIVKRLVHTADGQLMLLSTNGNTPCLLPIVTSPLTLQSASRSLVTSAEVSDTATGVEIRPSPSVPQQRIILKTVNTASATGTSNPTIVTTLNNTSSTAHKINSPNIISLAAQNDDVTTLSNTPATLPSASKLIKRIKVMPSFKTTNEGKTAIVLTTEQLQNLTSQSLASQSQNAVTTQPVHDNSQIVFHQVDQENTSYETEESNLLASSHYDGSSPCPICQDKISGYHYGIFTCESCKGFFKRTVQNKKAFICHRKGDCDINVIQRKKCPACRFKRCLLAGMKLEAVREDRQRGGRSSYDGAQNYSRARQALNVGSTSRPRVMKRELNTTPVRQTDRQTVNKVITMVYPDGTEVSVQQESKAALQPHTPAVLEDLMAVESLMTEEDTDQECCRNKFVEGDENLFMSLLHFADHCLYKIVRWARNLPDFAAVSTDDQILLLQNCWGELLCLCCCWNSLRCQGELRVASGRTLSIEVATMLGVEELVTRMLDYVALLRQLELDNHEFIALKTLLLLNPDVKSVRDERVIRQYQERISSALLVYSASHYPEKDNKFCQLLCRLPELSRLSVMGKDILRSRQTQGDLPQYSLLSELLKGDSVVQT